jgi:hypothetical protein
MFSKYAAPAMDDIDMIASAECGCKCGLNYGNGGGDKDYSPSDVQDMLDDYYRELRKKIEEIKKKYPGYRHPDFPDDN